MVPISSAIHAESICFVDYHNEAGTVIRSHKQFINNLHTFTDIKYILMEILLRMLLYMYLQFDFIIQVT